MGSGGRRSPATTNSEPKAQPQASPGQSEERAPPWVNHPPRTQPRMGISINLIAAPEFLQLLQLAGALWAATAKGHGDGTSAAVEVR
jgi:hypothetical protein